jgi:hypothetical protein
VWQIFGTGFLHECLSAKTFFSLLPRSQPFTHFWSHIWGRCYDRDFRQFWRFSQKPMLWSKFCIILLCFESKAPIFCNFFRENIFKIIPSVPWLSHVTFVVVVRQQDGDQKKQLHIFGYSYHFYTFVHRCIRWSIDLYILARDSIHTYVKLPYPFKVYSHTWVFH